MMDNIATEQLGLSLERANFLKKRSQSFLSVARQSGLAGHAFTQRDDALSDDHAAVISGIECGEEVTLLQESLQNIDFAIHKLDAINNDEVAEPDVMAFYQDAIELLDEAEALLEECCEVDLMDYAMDEIEWDESSLVPLEDDPLFADGEGDEE
ncbi:hypothetical protein MML63_02175 [Kosakonia sacchari]|uniref:hypothetical protein n=1 Tax=Kosakonia sacchari TaxID=1158459 RepID=UPI0025B0B9F5|nr:hypothetical protein [Kosakonia sacchari]MDN2484444.1 hypothetical protein [Kosakonia sacchari]